MIAALDVMANGILHFSSCAVNAPSNLLFRQCGKPALHQIQLGRCRGSEMQMKMRMPGQPTMDQGRFAGL